MPSILIRILLFLSSYFPLALIVAVKLYIDHKIYWSSFILGLGTFGLIGISVYLRYVKRINPLSISIQTISRKDGESMSYIVTYLLPFIALPSSDLGNLFGLGIVLFVLAVLYINSDMMHINPMLNLSGWHVYEIMIENGNICTFITKKRLRKGREASAVEIADDFYIEV